MIWIKYSQDIYSYIWISILIYFSFIFDESTNQTVQWNNKLFFLHVPRKFVSSPDEIQLN